MKVLIVNNNMHIRMFPQAFLIRRNLGEANVRECLPQDLVDSAVDVDRVIITGSTAYVRQERDWMHKERTFIDRWMKKGIPILGICFGAQLLARHLFGKEAVVALPYPISGSIVVQQVGSSPLFSDMPKEFGSVATHYEGCVVPDEYVIARSPEWPVYAFVYPGNVYGVQFHPELHGFWGGFLVRMQRLMYDRHVYQEWAVPTVQGYGKKLFSNFIGSTTT